MRVLQTFVVMVVIAAPGCASRGDRTVGQSLGEAGLRFYQAMDQAGKLAKGLEQAEVIPTEDALRIQEAFLVVNTSQQPFTDGLRRLDQLEQMDASTRVKTLQYVIELTGTFTAQLDLVFERLGETDQTAEIRAALQAAREALELIRLAVQPWLEEGVA